MPDLKDVGVEEGASPSEEDIQRLRNAARLEEAVRLAAEGKFRCGCCGRICSAGEGVVIMLRGRVALGLCMDQPGQRGTKSGCVWGIHIEIKPDPKGLRIIANGDRGSILTMDRPEAQQVMAALNVQPKRFGNGG